MNVKRLLFIIIIFQQINLFAISKVDSLLFVLQKTKTDTSKVVVLNKIAWEYRKNELAKAFEYLNQARILGEKHNFSSGLAITYKYIGILNYNENNLDSALYYYTLSINQFKIMGDSSNLGRMYHNLGSAYLTQTNYKPALENYLKSLEIKEKLKDQIGIIQSYKDIGLLYMQKAGSDTADLTLALKYCKTAFQLNQRNGDKELHANLCNYIGLTFYYKTKYDSAYYYFEQERKIAKELDNSLFLAQSLEGIGRCNTEKKEYVIAIRDLEESLKLYTDNDEVIGITNVLHVLGLNYKRLNMTNKAIEFFLKSYKLTKENGMLETQKENLMYLSELYSKISDFETAYYYQTHYKDISDSISNDNNRRALTQMQFVYEFDKKQKEQEIEKQKQAARLDQMRLLTYFFGVALILMLLLVLFVYKNFRDKKRANVLLIEKNNEIEKQSNILKQLNFELQQQKEEITVQRDEIHEKSKIIEHKNRNITDSITYASRIQSAVLPPDDVLEEIEHFILYKPRDIVSGDFYWVRRIKNFFYIAVADCTGHGVPGAFMSMLGVSLLNEIVNRKTVNNANEVLNLLRRNLKKSLWQTGKGVETKDGMDIALCIIDIDSLQIQYAGANNSLYVYHSNGEFTEVKPDKMPIGSHPREDLPFTNHEIHLQRGDTIYLFSDGYVDQFGGEKDAKFLSRRFRDTLSQIYTKSMLEQRDLLEHTIEKWRGNRDQVDDISVMGLRFS